MQITSKIDMDDRTEILKNFMEVSRQALEKYLSHPNNEETREKITEYILDNMGVSTVAKITSESLWRKMKLFEKVLWFVSNKLIPFIGRKTRYQISQWNLQNPENRKEEPYWAVLNPKQIVMVDALLNPPCKKIDVTFNIPNVPE